VLYPTELRGHILIFKNPCFFVIIFLEDRSNLAPIGMIHLNLFLRRRMFSGVTFLAVWISACAASDPPLSISLYNPKTGIQRTCSAKEWSPSRNTSALSSAVETCAKQLEAHGFVRSDSR
jgi:hypothetical protein